MNNVMLALQRWNRFVLIFVGAVIVMDLFFHWWIWVAIHSIALLVTQIMWRKLRQRDFPPT